MATTAKQYGKHPGGRPRTVTPAVITPDILKRIDEMAEAQCKDHTIAQEFGWDPDTFKAEFSERTSQKRAQGKNRLMRVQFALAMDGNPTMAIWGGKQHLGQTDKQTVNGTQAITVTIVHHGGKGSDGAVSP